MGAVKHIADEDRQQLTVEILSDEALYTSEIEGEVLNRDSLQSSIRRNLGLVTDLRKVPPAEQGISQMLVELHREPGSRLTHELLCHWHELLMKGRRDVRELGTYRTDAHPMQVVSGAIHAPKVHYEAPPSAAVPTEMARFVDWFNRTAPTGASPLPGLTRAALAHLHFVCVHPFEDGNGRIARSLSEKALFQSLGQPVLLSLSHTINAKRSCYYEMLERTNKSNEVTEWLVYFAETVLDAQVEAQRVVDFTIAKARLLGRLRGQLNERQEKALLRMFREGPSGFKGGLSADNYIRITGASRATATRDLQDLVEKQALVRTGALKSTRYHLADSELEREDTHPRKQ